MQAADTAISTLALRHGRQFEHPFIVGEITAKLSTANHHI